MTPLESIKINNITFYIKRDDLIKGVLTGNKARKLKYYLNINSDNFETVVSLGGAQSNFMIALAKLAYHKNWKFHYYTKPFPKALKVQPTGNLAYALKLGMQHFELTADQFNIASIKRNYPDVQKIMFFEQGGKQSEAQLGLDELANEILQQTEQKKLKNYGVFIPSGTGASAYFYNKNYTL